MLPTTWKLEALEPKLLLSGDLAPGLHRIEGSIDQPGEQDRFEFSVQARTRFLSDGVQGDQISWQLQGPNNTDQFSLRNLTQPGDSFLDLEPGSYLLTVDGSGDRTGNDAFQRIGIEAALTLVPGTETSGQLPAGGHAALYRVDLAAGDRLYFQAGTASATGYFSRFDPGATRVWRQDSLTSDRSAYTALRSGSYWMSVEGATGATTALDYAFTLHRSAARSQALVLGETQAVTLAAPGDAVSDSFTLDRSTQVQWDQLSPSASALRWVLLNSDTSSQHGGGLLGSQDGNSTPMTLAAGRYTLRVETDGRAAASARFRLLSAQDAPLVAAQQAELLLPTGTALGGQVPRLQAAAPGNVSLAHLLQPYVVDGNTLDTARDLLPAAGESLATDTTLAADVADVELLRVQAVAGDTLDFTVPGSNLAQRLRLFDAAGVQLSTTPGSALSHAAAVTGLYYLGVSRDDNAAYDPTIAPRANVPASAGLLRLQLARQGAATPLPGADVPDTLAAARDLLLRARQTASVDSTIGDGAFGDRDVDFQRVALAAGEVLRRSPSGSTCTPDTQAFNASSELRQAEEGQQLAQAEHRQTVDQLARRQIRAPFAGVVVDHYLNPGALVDAGDGKKPILKIAQTQPLAVQAILPFRLFPQIQPGLRVVVRPEAPFGGAIDAVIRTKDRVIAAAAGTFGVVATLDNARQTLPAGIRCRLQVPGLK